MNQGILVIGATFVDIKGYPDGFYIPGGRNAGRVIQTHGGVCRNIAEDIGNVELRPSFVSVVDESGISADVLAKLERHRVNTEYIRKMPDGLGTWLAIFDSTGDVVASISKRPDLMPILEILEEHGDELFSNADSIVVEIDIDTPILKKVLELAGRHGKRVYSPVTNMSIAMERRDLLKYISCVVCNCQEAGLLFSEVYKEEDAEALQPVIAEKVRLAQMQKMVVTLGGYGAVYADSTGESGYVPAMKVECVDTTGCGDAFFAGVAIGLTYGKTLKEACEIGTRLASAVIATKESVCPRFLPEEFGLESRE
ncbi:MAG: bifunctional hydroxymethylpyrimidine kinase/phosphomethylpyrimidine kinase [Lachnospiraceae bacterium]|nr:bifunctional hydroxymethylpyrimidine kinase/phosphomethylpyrimidine kinase [Lachnospiraceae bacterium]